LYTRRKIALNNAYFIDYENRKKREQAKKQKKKKQPMTKEQFIDALLKAQEERSNVPTGKRTNLSKSNGNTSRT